MIMISYPARFFNTFSKIVKKIFWRGGSYQTKLKAAYSFAQKDHPAAVEYGINFCKS